MSVIKVFVIAAFAVAFVAIAHRVLADEPQITVTCPNGGSLQFHTLGTKYLGYWLGNTSDGRTIESQNMGITYQFYNNGYTVQFNNQINGDNFISCVYYLQDNITKVKSPLFIVSSAIHH